MAGITVTEPGTGNVLPESAQATFDPWNPLVVPQRPPTFTGFD